jgi:hypothetical protein
MLFPIFGISNQLLAAVAPAVCTTLLVRSGRLKWAWITGVPLAWDATVTLTAADRRGDRGRRPGLRPARTPPGAVHAGRGHVRRVEDRRPGGG